MPHGLPDGRQSPSALSVGEILEDEAVQRIREVLASPSWRWLTSTVRAAWEQDLSRQRVRVNLSALGDTEAAAMADFLRWPTHRSGVTTISLIRLDTLLRDSGLSTGLAACRRQWVGHCVTKQVGVVPIGQPCS